MPWIDRGKGKTMLESSFSSRVYAGLYLSLLGIPMAALLIIRRLKRDAGTSSPCFP